MDPPLLSSPQYDTCGHRARGTSSTGVLSAYFVWFGLTLLSYSIRVLHYSQAPKKETESLIVHVYSQVHTLSSQIYTIPPFGLHLVKAGPRDDHKAFSKASKVLTLYCLLNISYLLFFSGIPAGLYFQVSTAGYESVSDARRGSLECILFSSACFGFFFFFLSSEIGSPSHYFSVFFSVC